MFNLVTGIMSGVSALVFYFVYLPDAYAKDAYLQQWNTPGSTLMYDPHYTLDATVLTVIYGTLAVTLLLGPPFTKLCRHAWRKVV